VGRARLVLVDEGQVHAVTVAQLDGDVVVACDPDCTIEPAMIQSPDSRRPPRAASRTWS